MDTTYTQMDIISSAHVLEANFGVTNEDITVGKTLRFLKCEEKGGDDEACYKAAMSKNDEQLYEDRMFSDEDEEELIFYSYHYLDVIHMFVDDTAFWDVEEIPELDPAEQSCPSPPSPVRR